ncbi:hypothetical protein CL620_03320 [archaeon]|nr:hypothetical protein [archaeon]
MPTNQVARNTVPYNDISDDTYLDFTTQPSPKWSGISPESMEYNGDVSHARFLIQPVSEPNQTYNEGRTEATVHRMPANKKVFKTNHDKSLDDLECRIYQALKNAGLNVPGVQRETEGFVMDYAGSTSFIDHAYYNLWPICSELDIKNLMDMGIEMAHLISIFDYVASNEIGAEDKERLRNMASAKVAAKFNVPNQTAHERYFMFRMLEAVPHADQETVKLLQPIEDMMTHALDRYPSWTVDVHPGNLFPNFTSHKFDDFVGIDFNRMKYGPMQMAESFAFDKPLLCGGFNGRALALQWGDILTAKTSDGRQGVNFQANVFSSISPVLFAERKFGIYSDRHTARALRDLVANKGLRNVTRKDANSLVITAMEDFTSPWDELTRRALTGDDL